MESTSSPRSSACPVSGFTIEEIEPRLFSFNNPYGACPACDGLGTELFFEPDMVVPDESLSLASAAPPPPTPHRGHTTTTPHTARRGGRDATPRGGREELSRFQSNHPCQVC